MGNVKKSARVQDTDIKRLNHVGIGLKTIAEILGCHPATITLRLKEMNIKPTDTRRSFMEQVFLSLKPEVQEWLSHNLFNAEIDIKNFVVALINEAYLQTPQVVPAVPTPMPELDGAPALESPEDHLGATDVAELVPAEATVTVEPERLEEVQEVPVETVSNEKVPNLFG